MCFSSAPGDNGLAAAGREDDDEEDDDEDDDDDDEETGEANEACKRVGGGE